MTAAFDFAAFASALPVLLLAATLTWLLSLPLRNVAIADVLWGLMLFAAGVVHALASDPRAPRLSLTLWLLALWAARLAICIAARDAGRGERRHYRAMRARHEPRFAIQSLYLVFWLRAVQAWIVSLPLLGAFSSNRPMGVIDAFGVALFTVGFVIETAVAWSLSRFKRDPAHADDMKTDGLFAYSRHPDYFGEACVWWGFWLLAVSAGAWWSLPGPLLISYLMWRAARLPVLSREGGNPRPQDADYVLKTNAFFPWLPRK